jgi:molybdopterin converting factor small subunit
MRVRVRLLGSLRQHGTPKAREYELTERADIESLIHLIVAKNPELTGILNGVGNLVMLNGVEIGNIEGFKTPLCNGSEVVFVPVTHGGR